mmetsp:Transcript_25862/g.36811  ORF Transcript_25862/g.36811 Transcript_25862/m.36811 type:complete len:102 (+) Transcript_25862:186-491(+)
MAKYRRAVEKLLHVMRWSRPEVLNPVRETSKFMKDANEYHNKAEHRIMKYFVDTPEHGLVLSPVGKWDGKDKTFEFVIQGRCDSEFVKDPTRKVLEGVSCI